MQGPMNSIDSILALVENTKTRYQGTHEKKKVLKWLRRLSTRVCYYGQVLDVLAQHHPEYVALAWGTLKFVLTVSGILHLLNLSTLTPTKTSM